MFYPSLTFISFSSVLSSCPRHIIAFFSNPSESLSPSASASSLPSTSSSSMSIIPTIAPYLSRVSTADLLGYTSSIIKPQYLRNCGRLPYGASRTFSLDLLLSEINTSTMESLLYRESSSREAAKRRIRRRRKIISPCNVLLSMGPGESSGACLDEMSRRAKNAIEDEDHNGEERDGDSDEVYKVDQVIEEKKDDDMDKDKRECIGRGRKRSRRRERRSTGEGEEADRMIEGDGVRVQQEKREDRESCSRSSFHEDEREQGDGEDEETLGWMDHMSEEEVEEEKDRSSFKRRERKDHAKAFLTFPERVKKELQTWKGVKISCDVPIAPFLLPFAIDMHSLSRYLGASPPCERKPESQADRLHHPPPHTHQVNARSLLKGRGGEDEEEEEVISPETHILVDLLWKDFDFYIDLKSSSPASSASSPSLSSSSGFSSFLSKEKNRQNESGMNRRDHQHLQREDREEKEANEKEQEKRRSSQSLQEEEEDRSQVSIHLTVQQPRRLSKSWYQPNNLFSEDFSSSLSSSSVLPSEEKISTTSLHLQEKKEINPLDEVETSEKNDREEAVYRNKDVIATSWSSCPSVDDLSHKKEAINILTIRNERFLEDRLDEDRKEDDEEEENRRRERMESNNRKQKQKRGGPLLCAGKHAELNALRRQGWRVICISEVTWLQLEEEVLKRRRNEMKQEDDGDEEGRKGRCTEETLDLFKRYILTCIAALGKRKGEKETPR